MMITVSQLRKLFLFIFSGRGEAQPNALFNQFGDAMGPDANVDPEANKYPTQPQLNPRQQSEGQCFSRIIRSFIHSTLFRQR